MAEIIRLADFDESDAPKPSKPTKGPTTHGLVDVKYFAAAVGISDFVVSQMCRAKELEHLRVGRGRGQIRFRIEDVERYIESCVVKPEVKDRKAKQKALKAKAEVRVREITSKAKQPKTNATEMSLVERYGSKAKKK